MKILFTRLRKKSQPLILATKIHKGAQRKKVRRQKTEDRRQKKQLNKKFLRMLHGSWGAVFSKRVPLAAGGSVNKGTQRSSIHQVQFFLNRDFIQL
jgi:hypothetical protein